MSIDFFLHFLLLIGMRTDSVLQSAVSVVRSKIGHEAFLGGRAPVIVSLPFDSLRLAVSKQVGRAHLVAVARGAHFPCQTW